MSNKVGDKVPFVAMPSNSHEILYDSDYSSVLDILVF